MLSSRQISFYCSFITRRVIPEVLSKYAERTVDTFSPGSYRGGSDARKPTYRGSARGSPNSYRGFWRTSPDLLYDKRDYDRHTNDRRKLGEIYARISDSQYWFARYQETKSVTLDPFRKWERVFYHLHLFICTYTAAHEITHSVVLIYTEKYTQKKWNLELSDIRTGDVCEAIVAL